MISNVALPEQLTQLQTNTFKWTLYFLDTVASKTSSVELKGVSHRKFQQNQHHINGQLVPEWNLSQTAVGEGHPWQHHRSPNQH